MKPRSKSYQSLALALGIWSGIAVADLLALKALLFLPLLAIFRRHALASVLLATATGVVILLIHTAALDQNPINSFVGSSVEIEGVVSSEPGKTRPRVIGSRLTLSKMTFLMRAEQVSSNEFSQQIRIPIRVIIDSESPFFPGEQIKLKGELIQTKERRVSALLLAEPASVVRINSPFMLRALERVRSALREETSKVGGDSASLIPGMVIGDTSLQSGALTELMLEAGLSHLTAVSGANFAIVSAFIFALIGIFLPNRRIQVIMTILVLFIFVLLVRPTPSVLRAGVMALVFLISKLSGRKSAGANSLAVAVAILLLINPFQAFEAGFILSVLATAGLIFFAPIVAARIPGPRFLGELISIPTAATLFCAPYLMLISGSMNIGTILLNIVVAPVVPFVTILGFIATLVVLPVGSAAGFLLELANLGTSWILFIASWSESMPSIVTSAPVLIMLAISLGILKFFGVRVAALILMIFLAFATNQRFFFPGEDWRIGQCDVGQGDALLLNLGQGSAILFDAGPDPSLLERCLELFRIERLPLVVISHTHADHLQGLSGIGKREVGEIWSNKELTSISTRVVRSGFRSEVGSSKIEILWPETGAESFESVSGDGSAENNRSVVALVELDGVRALITGDIEPGAQSEILDGLPKVDVIKVPHHGSKYQELELFNGASVFLVSVGQNSYGHPDMGLISSLERLGSVFRSDLNGSIALSWRSDASGKPIFSARLLGKEWWRIAWH